MSASITLETITPAKATKYLEKNTANRPVRKVWVKTLAETIKNGQWHVTHQGIAFNCDGTLIDGQNRLMAIVEAGKPVQMYVARGIAKESVFGIDSGKTRSVPDIAGPLGFGLGDITKNHSAVARAMTQAWMDFQQRMRHYETNETVLRFVVRHREAIDFAIGNLNTGPAAHGVARAVVARAWYTADRARLLEFCRCLTTNIHASEGDSAAGALLRFLRSLTKGAGGAMVRRDMYFRTQAALRRFLLRESVKTLKPAQVEYFPIPEGDQE
jgi:hypothetical protein